MRRRSKHRVGPVESIERGAARSGVALVAIAVTHVTEISASSTLQHVAAERRHVAELWTCGELERLGDNRIIALDIGVVGDGRYPRHRAKQQVSVLQFDFRPGTGKRIDIDERA